MTYSFKFLCLGSEIFKSDADIQRASLFELFQSIRVCIFLFIWVDVIFFDLALYFSILVQHRLRGETPQLCKPILRHDSNKIVMKID